MKNDTKSIWLDGIMGVVVGDALGVPVEFMARTELAKNPVTEMIGYGTYNMPEGTWSDDSSMTLAMLDSLKNGYDLKDIMENFVKWLASGKYTPFGKAFDIGGTCLEAILRYFSTKDCKNTGGYDEYDNGNGSLMRCMPICLYVYEQQKKEGLGDFEAVQIIHEVSALTHAHLRSKIGCGLYYFMVKSILENEGTLMERLQLGLNAGFSFYEQDSAYLEELRHYCRMLELDWFAQLEEKEIKSYGYVVASLEAAVWCLVNSSSLEECLLKAVNLGGDTDTVAAIAGGLAGLYYGYEAIPDAWLSSIQKRAWIEDIISQF